MATEFFFYYETCGESNHYRKLVEKLLEGKNTQAWIEPRDVDGATTHWLLKFTVIDPLSEEALSHLHTTFSELAGYDGWGKPVSESETTSDSYTSSSD